ncbi:MAG: efflux RND transporter periplasmic adaptor subunit [Deltaproteobacteria bacterium]|nr:efflux RND transporter periplasmic adaptor subunit [Deltaproteobacteria bacterium]
MLPGLKKVIYAATAIAAVAGLAVILLPDPVPVEATKLTVGSLQVTIDEDGETRAHDRFIVSAPVSGRASRIELHEGDRVARDQVLLELWPLPLSAREREEQLARIAAVDALAREASERVRRVQAEYEQARRDRQRMEKLSAGGFISKQDAEQASVAETTRANELEAARFRARSADADVRAARAALLALDEKRAGSARIPIRSPVAGKVLRIPEKSERVVAAGAPLMTIGDPARLEVVIDLLSADAVKVKPGMPVLLEGWGGDKPLRARVRVVEPYGFTKVSALGVEEQRVNVIADFVDPPGPLGDGYRVEAKIVTWSGEGVLKVPVSALFRHGETWAVFVVESGRAKRRQVQIGHRGALEAEIVAGLKKGDAVIRHPSNDIADGTRVKVVT